MARSDHFETAVDWAAAQKLIAFRPQKPKFTAGFSLTSLAVHVMDHRGRRLGVAERSLEAHYTGFVIEQRRAASQSEAQGAALSTTYGLAAQRVDVAGFEGRGYPLGPEVGPDDIDGRSPAVVAWSEREMFYLVASGRLDLDVLLRIASSMYPESAGGKRRRGAGG